VPRARTSRSRQERLYEEATRAAASLQAELEDLFGSLSDLEEDTPAAAVPAAPLTEAPPATTSRVTGTDDDEPAALPVATTTVEPPTPPLTPDHGRPTETPAAVPMSGYSILGPADLQAIPWDRIRREQKYRYRNAGRTVMIKRLRKGEFRIK